jgi:hypothetical protein
MSAPFLSRSTSAFLSHSLSRALSPSLFLSPTRSLSRSLAHSLCLLLSRPPAHPTPPMSYLSTSKASEVIFHRLVSQPLMFVEAREQSVVLGRRHVLFRLRCTLGLGRLAHSTCCDEETFGRVNHDLYVCMYVCIYVCMYMWMYVCACMHTYVYTIHTYTHTHTHTPNTHTPNTHTHTHTVARWPFSLASLSSERISCSN